jgi:hypothetical protein
MILGAYNKKINLWPIATSESCTALPRCVTNLIHLCYILGFQSGDYKQHYFLVCDAVLSGRVHRLLGGRNYLHIHG